MASRQEFSLEPERQSWEAKMQRDTVRLIVPATPEYARTVRMTASELVSRSHLTFEGVDEVRLAAEELFVYAADRVGASGEVCMEFHKGEEAFEINVSVSDSPTAADEDGESRASFAHFLLQAVCDRFEMSTDEDGTHLRVVKNLPAESEDALH